MRILALGIAAVLAAACGSFGTDLATSPTNDGGAVVPSGDAASDVPRDAGSALACGSGEAAQGLVESFQNQPATWVPNGAPLQFTEENLVADPLPSPRFAHASVEATKPQDFFGSSSRREVAIAPKDVRLDYDLAVNAISGYSEFGCQLELAEDATFQARLAFWLGSDRATTDGITHGYDYFPKNGSPSSSPNQSRVLGWQKQRWQHITVDASIKGRQVQLQTRVDDLATNYMEDIPEANFDITMVRITCGVPYLEMPANIDLGFANVRVQLCP